MTTNVALKEWQAVCDLLGEGRQILLLRKGGIHEGQNRLEIEHRRFLLLPTRLHQDPAMVKPAFRGRVTAGEAEPASFHIRYAGEISDILAVRGRPTMDRLRDQHCWDEPYVDLRFNYRPERPLYLLLVRAYALAEPFDLANTYKVAGCRSWVPLEGGHAMGEPVLSEDEYENRRETIISRLR